MGEQWWRSSVPPAVSKGASSSTTAWPPFNSRLPRILSSRPFYFACCGWGIWQLEKASVHPLGTRVLSRKQQPSTATKTKSCIKAWESLRRQLSASQCMQATPTMINSQGRHHTRAWRAICALLVTRGKTNINTAGTQKRIRTRSFTLLDFWPWLVVIRSTPTNECLWVSGPIVIYILQLVCRQMD